MNEEEYYNPVQLVKNVPDNGMLDRRNPDLMGNIDAQTKLLEKYLEIPKSKEDTTKEFIRDFMGFFNQQILLTFNRIEDRELFDNYFELAYNYYVMSKSPGTINFDHLRIKSQMKPLFLNMFMRSVGGNGIENERKMQQMSVFQHITSNQSPRQSQRGGIRGILDKFSLV